MNWKVKSQGAVAERSCKVGLQGAVSAGIAWCSGRGVARRTCRGELQGGMARCTCNEGVAEMMWKVSEVQGAVSQGMQGEIAKSEL